MPGSTCSAPVFIDISRTYVLLVGVVDFVLLLLGRYLSYSGIALMRKRLKRYHYFLIVGSGNRAREMATLIEDSRGMGPRLVGFVDPNSEGSSLGDRFGRYEVFPPSRLEQVLQQHVIDEVVFAVNMRELARLEPLMEHCANVGVKVRVQLEFLPEAYSRIYRKISTTFRCSASPVRRRVSYFCSSSGLLTWFYRLRLWYC